MCISVSTNTRSLLTKYVGFDGEREVCVISEDVNSFRDGDVLKVLTIDLHDLKQHRKNNKIIGGFDQNCDTQW